MKESYKVMHNEQLWPRVLPRRTVRAWGSVNRGKHRRAIELRNHQFRDADRVVCTGRQYVNGCLYENTLAHLRSCGVVEPSMCGHSLHGNREISEYHLHGINPFIEEAWGKEIYTAQAYGSEKSDIVIVPKKPANNMQRYGGVGGGKDNG